MNLRGHEHFVGHVLHFMSLLPLPFFQAGIAFIGYPFLEGFSYAIFSNCNCKWLSGRIRIIFAFRTILFCFKSKVQRGGFPIQSHFSSIHKNSSSQLCQFLDITLLWLSSVTDCANFPVVRELYTSLHLPTLVCLGSNGPVGPIYLPHPCIMNKRCTSQHSRASAKSYILSLKLTVLS